LTTGSFGGSLLDEFVDALGTEQVSVDEAALEM
jgi:hypothetical protein